MIVYSAWFDAIDTSWPLHAIQPLGTREKENSRISPTYGSDIASSPWQPHGLYRRRQIIPFCDAGSAERALRSAVAHVQARSPRLLALRWRVCGRALRLWCCGPEAYDRDG